MWAIWHRYGTDIFLCTVQLATAHSNAQKTFALNNKCRIDQYNRQINIGRRKVQVVLDLSICDFHRFDCYKRFLFMNLNNECMWVVVLLNRKSEWYYQESHHDLTGNRLKWKCFCVRIIRWVRLPIPVPLSSSNKNFHLLTKAVKEFVISNNIISNFILFGIRFETFTLYSI